MTALVPAMTTPTPPTDGEPAGPPSPPVPPSGNGGGTPPPGPGGAGPCGPDHGGPGPSGGPPPVRLLRRSRTNRMATGLCGGLGEYFGVDPVLFRVLFAVLSVFGGAGVLLYLVGWLIVPEEGSPESGLDRVIADLRRRNVSFAVAVGVLAVLAWLALFSWWAPAGLIPAVAVAAVALFLLAYRDHPRVRSAAGLTPPNGPAPAATPPTTTAPTADSAARATGPADPTTVLRPGDTAGSTSNLPLDPDAPASAWPPPQATAEPTPAGQLRQWREESRQRARERRRRNRPVRVAVWSGLLIATVALGVADALTGIPVITYFWVAGLIVLLGLVVGAALHRTAWGPIWLLVPCAVVLVAFGGSAASLRDGSGDRLWQPTSAGQLASSYRSFAGQATLDLRDLTDLPADRTVHVIMGAGQLRLRLPAGVPVTVHARLRSGDLAQDGADVADGLDVEHDLVAGPATGTRLTLDVQLAAGRVDVTG